MADPGPLSTAPVLSTPDTHIFEDPTPAVDVAALPKLSDEQLYFTYEIKRTVDEIRKGRWRRIALQFPDEMLVDAPRVYEAVSRGLKKTKRTGNEGGKKKDGVDEVTGGLEGVRLEGGEEVDGPEAKLTILADTSYGACCVDEVAAEHVDADVVVHYGRACLSPTARLPVIYVFCTRPLELDAVVETFKKTHPCRTQRIVLMADIPYTNHIPALHQRLEQEGYPSVFPTEVINNPSSPLPNRTVPPEVQEKSVALRDYELFHISDPPASLLLTLSSRVGAIHIYPTSAAPSLAPDAILANSSMVLRRRYALLTRLSTVSIFGILINTLSVKNYLHMVEHVKATIAAAGKKSYTFVVGKVNAAKVANFSEVGGWVVIGCWESSLIESKEFWRPIITPFELEVALMGDGERVWTGEWRGDFQAVLEAKGGMDESQNSNGTSAEDGGQEDEDMDDSEEESEPPEFDLRTGRYVSHSRPMRTVKARPVRDVNGGASAATKSLIKRANGELAQIGGVASPGAEFLRTGRTWQGLGSDFEVSYDENRGAPMEQGRSGIARGYAVGQDAARR